MALPVIGFSPDADVRIDLATLLERRLLIQAASGAGKSTLARAFIEQLSGTVQQWVIDREGDLITLREAGDFVLVGKGGDAPADLATVKLLARRLMELGMSVIFDLSDLRMPEQREYVKRLFDEITHMPRTLWHPMIVWLDEGHLFAPEKESAVSLPSVIDAASLWRKRGYCLALLTQRLSKLDKDVAAELHNKIIGYTDDVDLRRAADQLGIGADQRASLQLLEPGQFYARGPAISRASVLVQAATPRTVPPPKGQARAIVPPPPEKVRAILGQLADLAKESEEELRTVEDLRRGIAERERTIRQLQKGGAERVVTKPVIDQAVIERAVSEAARALDGRWQRAVVNLIGDIAAKIDSTTSTLAEEVRGMSIAAQSVPSDAPLRAEAAVRTSTHSRAAVQVEVKKGTGYTERVDSTAGHSSRAPASPVVTLPAAESAVPRTQQRILDTIKEFEKLGVHTPTRGNVGAFLGLSATAGSFKNYLGALRTAGYITYPTDGQVALTESGRAIARSGRGPKSLQELHDVWFSKLPGTHERILRVVVEAYPDSISREEIAADLGLSHTAGSFKNYLGALRSLGLINYPADGIVIATDLLFPEGLT